MCESEALDETTTIKTITLFSLFQGNDAMGPLNCDEERSVIQLRLIYIHTYIHASHAHMHGPESQQAIVFLLWECEASPSHSLVPGGNGTEHLANQLQLSPLGLKVSPPTGMIYSQVQRENRSLSVPLFLGMGSWLRRVC